MIIKKNNFKTWKKTRKKTTFFYANERKADVNE